MQKDKWTDGKEAEAEEELEMQEEKNKLNKVGENVGSCINWMSLYGFIGAQWHEIKPC